ncbi:hypothetical protein [Thermodesulfovibrio hydrogeniphilus]
MHKMIMKKIDPAVIISILRKEVFEEFEKSILRYLNNRIDCPHKYT